MSDSSRHEVKMCIRDRAWTAETPYLYKVYISLKNKQGVAEVIPQKMCIRDSIGWKYTNSFFFGLCRAYQGEWKHHHQDSNHIAFKMCIRDSSGMVEAP